MAESETRYVSIDTSTAPAVGLAHVTTVPMTLHFLRGQTRYMRDRKLDVHAISSSGPALVAFGREQGVATHAVEMSRQIAPVQDLAVVRRLVKTLRAIRPAIVHAHTPKGGLLGMIAATINCVPVRVYHVRGLPYMAATGRKRVLLRITERVSCLLADRVFCVSHSIRDVALRDGLCPANKITVFGGGSGNGVDATGTFNPDRVSTRDRELARLQLGIPPNAVVFGFVGRIVRDKGIHELAEAWQSLRRTHPAAHLVLVGPVEPQDPVDPNVMRDLLDDSRVHLPGAVGDTSLWYPVFDVVVLPTYREGFPNVPLEAAAMELPVVSTRIPGCIDSVEDGVTGTLVPPRDAVALECAIRRYLDDPELRARHGRAGRARVLREFRQEEIWEAIHQEYVRLLAAKGIAVPFAATGGPP